MCAIAGILNFDPDRPVDRDVLLRMRDSMVHRGPDDAGIYLNGAVGLAARRLAIIDLERGNQPIHNEDRTVWVVLNGEIYNYRSLRRDLESLGHRFNTESDTEVLVHGYEEFGLDVLQRSKGMFAFALWDERDQTLFIARDRMGEKPLHYYCGPGEFVFGSEIKSLLLHPAVPREMDAASLSKYLALQYVPAPDSLLREVHKLLPGHYLTVRPRRCREIAQHQYWDIPRPPNQRSLTPMADLGEEFLGLLRSSVQAQLGSDVPVGVLMSGGLDSTLVATFAAEAQPGIKTFTLAFDDPTFDESRQARLVAERIGSDHHIEVCRARDMIDCLPNITAILDEPLADASLLPTYVLTRFTSRFVKVAVGGDGGDELFGGYPTFQALRYRSIFRRLPRFVRNAIALGVDALPVSHEYLSLDFKAKQFLRGIDGTPESDFLSWMGAFSESEKQNVFGEKLRAIGGSFKCLEGTLAARASGNEVERCLYLCAKLYLQDGILVKVDRASMANSLEVRSPFLDTDLIEFSARCPLEYKMTATQTKLILRNAARAILPGEILWGKKRGFAAPIGKWIMGDLKDLFRDTLNPDRMRKEDLFNPKEVQRLLDEHVAGKRNNSRLLWTLLVFELWKERMN